MMKQAMPTFAAVVTALCAMVISPQALAQATPGYNHKIPAKIMTPDRVETRIGTLKFFDGMPDKATVDKVYDNLSLMRGVETFLNGIPATSIEAVRLGFLELGLDSFNKIGIADGPLDSAPLFLTGNTDTVYVMNTFDLKKYGPMVVEVPPKSGPGTVNDAYFRFVTDMGGPGPDPWFDKTWRPGEFELVK